MKQRFVTYLLLATMVAVATPCFGRKIRTTRNTANETAVTAPSATTAPRDTVVPANDGIVLSGYDKPLRSTREVVFVTNNTDRDIDEIVFTTAYYDLQDRELHRRQLHKRIDLPAGSTRRMEYRSWDTQQSFYYEHSAAPRRAATPYKVRQRVDTVFCIPANNLNNR